MSLILLFRMVLLGREGCRWIDMVSCLVLSNGFLRKVYLERHPSLLTRGNKGDNAAVLSFYSHIMEQSSACVQQLL